MYYLVCSSCMHDFGLSHVQPQMATLSVVCFDQSADAHMPKKQIQPYAPEADITDSTPQYA